MPKNIKKESSYMVEEFKELQTEDMVKQMTLHFTSYCAKKEDMEGQSNESLDFSMYSKFIKQNGKRS